MFRRKTGLGTAIALAAAVTAAPAYGACDMKQTSAASESGYEQWSNTDAAVGRINMHDVQQAFRDSPDVAAFERRVNEVYEGDWLVLVRTSVDQDRVFLEGWEDLNGSGEIEDEADDQLFEISGESGREYRIKGRYTNSHYEEWMGPGNFLLVYTLVSAMDPATGYYRTPPERVDRIHEDRRLYRQTRAYRAQQARNQAYGTAYTGSKYQNAPGARASLGRRTYQSTMRRSGAFQRGSVHARSVYWSGQGRAGGGGGMGAGGLMRVRGAHRIRNYGHPNLAGTANR